MCAYSEGLVLIRGGAYLCLEWALIRGRLLKEVLNRGIDSRYNQRKLLTRQRLSGGPSLAVFVQLIVQKQNNKQKNIIK